MTINILELAPMKNKRSNRYSSNDPVFYSWHSNNQKGTKHRAIKALSFRLSDKTLKQVRFVDGDRCSIHINDEMTEVIFVISTEGYKLTKSGKHRVVGVNYEGVEKLMEIFPEGKQVTLPIVETCAGKVICKIPKQKVEEQDDPWK